RRDRVDSAWPDQNQVMQRAPNRQNRAFYGHLAPATKRHRVARRLVSGEALPLLHSQSARTLVVVFSLANFATDLAGGGIRCMNVAVGRLRLYRVLKRHEVAGSDVLPSDG